MQSNELPRPRVARGMGWRVTSGDMLSLCEDTHCTQAYMPTCLQAYRPSWPHFVIEPSNSVINPHTSTRGRGEQPRRAKIPKLQTQPLSSSFSSFLTGMRMSIFFSSTRLDSSKLNSTPLQQPPYKPWHPVAGASSLPWTGRDQRGHMAILWPGFTQTYSDLSTLCRYFDGI